LADPGNSQVATLGTLPREVTQLTHTLSTLRDRNSFVWANDHAHSLLTTL
jgi:hypothetical protein